ncbi:hypothetical protein L596_023678 [Steinernema carpocapsae]|uniref:Uncharacterized protein n=1 Tax=Steinernema carpocapsae TaxID=34508 RepID=A0A4U5MEF0_STECR|nr:hypothetical protein L596_023678 [Steinernema carpocapsae]
MLVTGHPGDKPILANRLRSGSPELFGLVSFRCDEQLRKVHRSNYRNRSFSYALCSVQAAMSTVLGNDHGAEGLGQLICWEEFCIIGGKDVGVLQINGINSLEGFVRGTQKIQAVLLTSTFFRLSQSK